MSEVATITDPDHLNEFHIAAGLSSLSTGGSGPSPEPTSQTQKVKLVLLQLLATLICLQPAVLQVLASLTESLVFLVAVSLASFWISGPSANEGRNVSFQKVYWDIGMPKGDTLCVQAGDVMNLVITIATETRVRARGNVCFEVVYDEAEGVAPRVLTRLDKQLLALQQFPGKKDGDGVNGL